MLINLFSEEIVIAILKRGVLCQQPAEVEFGHCEVLQMEVQPDEVSVADSVKVLAPTHCIFFYRGIINVPLPANTKSEELKYATQLFIVIRSNRSTVPWMIL